MDQRGFDELKQAKTAWEAVLKAKIKAEGSTKTVRALIWACHDAGIHRFEISDAYEALDL